MLNVGKTANTSVPDKFVNSLTQVFVMLTRNQANVQKAQHVPFCILMTQFKQRAQLNHRRTKALGKILEKGNRHPGGTQMIENLPMDQVEDEAAVEVERDAKVKAKTEAETPMSVRHNHSNHSKAAR